MKINEVNIYVIYCTKNNTIGAVNEYTGNFYIPQRVFKQYEKNSLYMSKCFRLISLLYQVENLNVFFFLII